MVPSLFGYKDNYMNHHNMPVEVAEYLNNVKAKANYS